MHNSVAESQISEVKDKGNYFRCLFTFNRISTFFRVFYKHKVNILQLETVKYLMPPYLYVKGKHFKVNYLLSKVSCNLSSGIN